MPPPPPLPIQTPPSAKQPEESDRPFANVEVAFESSVVVAVPFREIDSAVVEALPNVARPVTESVPSVWIFVLTVVAAETKLTVANTPMIIATAETKSFPVGCFIFVTLL